MSSSVQQIAAVVLCGGRGTRMGSSDTHKVCFPIAGTPAILHLVGSLRAAGISRIAIVVGDKAGQVVSTVGQKYPDVIFVYQHEQLGTGHAARLGVEALQCWGQDGPILITMGDKFIEPAVFAELREHMIRTGADALFVTAPAKVGGSYGRVVHDDDGSVLGIVEVRDIARAKILAEYAQLAARRKAVSGSDLKSIGVRYIKDADRLCKALGPVAELLKVERIERSRLLEAIGQDAGYLTVAGRRFSGHELEKRCSTVNFGIYLAGAEVWYRVLPLLSNDNAQGEYYLPQSIELMASARDASGRRLYKISEMVLADVDSVMSFNSPDELLAIEVQYRRRQVAARAEPVVQRLDTRRFRPAAKWLELFESWPIRLQRLFERIYGSDESLIQRRRKEFIKVLKLFARRFGTDRLCCIARAPGRVNLLGRHIDHRGGHVNVMAIDREVLLVAAPRDDDVVRLVNTDSRRFPPGDFRISDLIEAMAWDDWLSYVNSTHVQQLVLRSQGDWTNYVKAAVLRLQQKYRDVMVRGMDAAVTGNIPQAAGLSSSSAVVVAAAEAVVAINGFDVTPAQFVDLCGEGEWFVGTRGGAADHAAIRFGRRGSVAHVGFFPFEVEKIVQLPSEAVVVMANSHVKAAKSAGARDRFNQRIACYELSFLLLKDRFPQYAHLLEHVRDINPRKLNCSIRDIYRMLLQVPRRMTRRQIVAALSGRHRERLERIFSTHAEPEYYDLRPVLAFGVGEAERSRICIDFLESGDLETFGQLMRWSHDGDRVVTHDADFRRRPYDYSTPDEQLQTRIEDLASEDPQRVARAQLYTLPGGYACSTEQIDLMVDAALRTPGVYGAQLAGAGLGGCMMALVHREAVERLKRTLSRIYYRPSGLPPAVIVCTPVEGSGLISI